MLRHVGVPSRDLAALVAARPRLEHAERLQRAHRDRASRYEPSLLRATAAFEEADLDRPATGGRVDERPGRATSRAIHLHMELLQQQGRVNGLAA